MSLRYQIQEKEVRGDDSENLDSSIHTNVLVIQQVTTGAFEKSEREFDWFVLGNHQLLNSPFSRISPAIEKPEFHPITFFVATKSL